MTEARSFPTRVAVVGAGRVGSTFAYALLLSGLASEIVLVDADRAKAEGEAMDLNHSLPFSHATRIWAGDYADCAEAAVTVVAGGAAQRPGETRLDLVTKNAAIFGEIVPAIGHPDTGSLLLIATNPVDVLTYVAWKLSGLPASRVIGSGTTLDTARFRYGLSRHCGVDPHNVHAYIIGEHGDSEVPLWSLANIAGIGLLDFCAVHGLPHNKATLDEIFSEAHDAAYRIIERKGATHYAVATGLLRIVEAILRDQNTVLTVSSLIDGHYGINDVCLSLPTILNRRGVERVLHLELSPEEVAGLQRSAWVLQETIDRLGLKEQ